jgi:periplasmic copper chaperone A
MVANARIVLAIVAALLVGASPTAAQAPDAAAGGTLRIEGAWARATAPAARTGAAYLTVINSGGEPDRLVGASSPAAAQAELHTHISEGNVARMQQLQAVDIPAGGRVSFAPGGLHVMLVNLQGPLRDGIPFALTLRFARAGEITIEVPVSRSAPAAAPAHRH